jgi:long-chain acyl-CoA synthetase
MTAFLAHRIAHHASARGAEPAVVTTTRSWTWRQLHDASGGVADHLAGARVEPGAIVVVAISRGPEAVFAVTGARRLGAVPAMVDPGDLEQAAAVCARLRPAAVLVRADDARAARLPGAIALDAASALARPGRPLGWQPGAPVLGVSHLIHTSGTTQDGKCIAWSEARAEADATTRAPVGWRGQRGRPGIVVPLCVSLGFHELLRALAHGCSVALVDDPFPVALRALDDLAVTGFQCTPTHVDQMLRSAVAMPRALRQINVSSAPIAGARLRELAARIAPAIVTMSYGLTEVGPVAVLRADELARGDSVGRPLADREVTIVDRRGRALSPGRTGEILVRVAASPPDGYFLPTAAQARRFAGGVLRTGDRGHLDGDGFLVLDGRMAELLKVGGRTVSAPRIEQLLAGLGVFTELAVVGVPHRRLGEVPAVAYTPSPDTPELAALERLVARRLRAEAAPRWFVARRSLPRSASGKLRRGVIAADLRRWVDAWPDSVTWGARILPARELAAPPGWPAGLGRVFVADGAPARWPRWAGGRPHDALARVVSVVDASGHQLFAVALVPGTGRATARVATWIAPAVRRSRLADVLAPVLADAARRLRGPG